MIDSGPSVQATGHARDDRSRVLSAIHGLAYALASASFAHEGAWRQRLIEAFNVLQTALLETREAANAKGSLLDQLTQEFPRLLNRAEKLRVEYGLLQKQDDEMREQITKQPSTGPDEVDQIREQLANLLTMLRRIQSKETELIFEGYHFDIGVGD